MTEILLAAVLGAGMLVLAGAWFKAQKGDIELLRAQARNQFRLTKAFSPADGISFDGSVATVLEEHETEYLGSMLRSNYILTIVAAMPDGSRYQFKSSSADTPTVACLSAGHGRAIRTRVGGCS
jgi:hypothetical protein